MTPTRRIALCGIAALLVFTVVSDLRGSSSGAREGQTGSPAEGGTTCASSGCHEGPLNLNTGPGSIALSGPSSYVPGALHEFEITVEEPGALRIGFQASFVDLSGRPAGVIELVGTGSTKFASNSPYYVTHRRAPFGKSSQTYRVRWHAPPAGAGPIDLYVAGVAANGDGEKRGDMVYTRSFRLTESAASGVLLGTAFVFFLNEVHGFLRANGADVVDDPAASAPAEQVLELDGKSAGFEGLGFIAPEGADFSAMVSEDGTTARTLNLRLLVQPEVGGSSDCAEPAGDCLSLGFIDSATGPQDGASLESGAGDPPLRLQWHIPEALRDGQWHDLAIPLPPATPDALEAARVAGTLDGLQTGWQYAGGPAGQEFDWERVSEMGVFFDFAGTPGGSVFLDDIHIGDPNPTDRLPSATTLTGPTSGALVSDPRVALQWESSTLAQSYDVLLLVDSSAPIVLTPDVNTVSVAQYLSPGSRANWRVRARNSYGAGPWTDSKSFTVSGFVPPTVQTPSEGEIAAALPVELAWSAVAEATSYSVQIADTPTMDDVLEEAAGILETAYVAGSLAAATRYYWRVRSNSPSGSSAWSTAASFRTAEVLPAAARLQSPADAAVDQAPSPTLTWRRTNYARYYEVHVSEGSDFVDLAADTTVELATSTVIAGLARGQQYFWRVRAGSNGGPGPWSDPFSFQVLVPEPGRPVIVSQPTALPQNPLLTWAPDSLAAAYQISISTGSDFSLPFQDLRSVANSVQVERLTPDTEYFWRVRGENAAGLGPWSETGAFLTVQNAQPLAVADSARVDEDRVLLFAVLENDSDPDDHGLAVTAVATPAHGTANIDDSGAVQYSPEPDYFGPDSLVYSITDDLGGWADGVLYVNVSPVNDPPPGPAITHPMEGITIDVSGDPDEQLRVDWTSSTDIEGDPVSYRWYLATSGEDVLFSAESAAVTASIRFGDLAALVAQSSNISGGEVQLSHWITASDGADSTRGAITSFTVLLGGITSIDDEPEIPTQLTLSPNYPNPFNPGTTLRFGLPSPGRVSLEIYDVLGRLVATPVDETYQAGWYAVRFDASRLSGGVYVQVLNVADRRESRALTLVK